MLKKDLQLTLIRQRMSVFGKNTTKYGPEKTPHLEIFRAVANRNF